MTTRRVFSQLIIIVVVALASALTVAEERRDVVISWSHSSPDTAYWRRHALWLEQRPFDGVVLEIDPRDAGWVEQDYWKRQIQWARRNDLAAVAQQFEEPRESGSLNWAGGSGLTSSDLTGPWNPANKYTEETLALALADFNAAKAQKFDHNFIVASLGGESTDWFSDEDFDQRCHNFAMLARLSRQAGCRGIFFDDEERGEIGHWNYDKLRRANAVEGQTFDQVRQKVQERGRAFAKALAAEFPDMVFWVRHGYSTAAHLMEVGLPEYARDLRTGFYDGVLEGSSDQMVFVDGGEIAHGFNTKEQFEQGRQTIMEEPIRLGLTQVPDLHRKKVRCGFGLWLDYFGQMDADNVEKAYFSPGRFQRALHWALKVGDGYVWVYGEGWTWWTEGPDDRGPVDSHRNTRGLPLAYWTALEAGRTAPGDDTSEVPGKTTGLLAKGRVNCIDGEQLQSFMGKTDRAHSPFDKEWTFKLDDWGDALDEPSTFDKAINIRKPWDEQGFTGDDTIGWYRLDFVLPPGLKERKLHLHFPDVDGSVWLWSISGPRPQLLAHRYIGSEPQARRQPFVLTHPRMGSHFFEPASASTLVIKVQRHSETGGILAPIVMLATKKDQ